ncbi:MAG TPA: ATP-binding protein [Clostridiales bacterium]|nr:MAG: hypothetical protein A2Y22_01105 [Clostridiales bacterium GWD2_32_59]HAN10590.1 ATP-binding protein [Clostridiales bacterium]
MKDQAQNLRDIIRKKNKDSKRMCSAKVMAITSGKGGVGKTNIALNLAIEFNNKGIKTLILDADLGLANIEVLLGIVPKYNLSDVIYGKKIITDIITLGSNEVKFISGGSCIKEITSLTETQIKTFAQNLNLLDKMVDVIIIDAGAGITDNVMTFLGFADEVLLVTTPELTAITDAYALLKVFSERTKKGDINVKLIINKVKDENEGQKIYEKIKKVADKFLNIKIEDLGYLPNDECLEKSVRTGQAVVIKYPKSEVTKELKNMAEKILNIRIDKNSTKGLKMFIELVKNKINIIKDL